MSNNWYQQQLTPPEVYEVNVRYGIIPSTDHLQVMVEMKDAMSGVLIGQWSLPHTPLSRAGAAIEWATRIAANAINDNVDPF